MNRLSVRAVADHLTRQGYDVGPSLAKAAQMKSDRERFEHLQHVRLHHERLREAAEQHAREELLHGHR
ncbi:hypothetical protein BH09PSE6_BH09PSE6_07240 [soil metagenome]